MHSFTPVFLDVARPWHAGVLFNRDARLAEPLLRLLRAEGDLVVGCNEPYAVTDTPTTRSTTTAPRATCPTSRSRSART